MKTRKQLSYEVLKRRTLRQLHKEYRRGQASVLRIAEAREDFVYDAVMLGYPRYTAEMDWDLEIRWRIKN